jgi:hypothetical protein
MIKKTNIPGSEFGIKSETFDASGQLYVSEIGINPLFSIFSF